MNRSTKRVVITSIVGGLLSGAVKIGWEAIVPPRTPEREKETLHDIIESGGLPDSIKKQPITIMVMIFQ